MYVIKGGFTDGLERVKRVLGFTFFFSLGKYGMTLGQFVYGDYAVLRASKKLRLNNNQSLDKTDIVSFPAWI